MPDESVVKPEGETPPTPPVTEPPVVPETPVEEPFDKERAMSTIGKLRDIEKQAKQDKKELEQLRAEKQKQADAELSEAQREKKRADVLASENAKIKTDLLRREVIDEVGLPATFASRLQGATREELLADAKELAKTLPQLKVAPKVPPTNPSNNQTTDKTQETRSWLTGGQGNPFDKNVVEQQGGGVFGKK